MTRYLDELGGPYGRSAYRRALEVSRVVERARDRLAAEFGIGRAECLTFQPNATAGLNLVLQGLLKPGDEVLVSPLEHNAVMRPLAAMKRLRGITWRVLPADSDGLVRVEELPRMLSSKTRLVVINHQSNVNGLIQPLQEIRKAAGDVPILVDAAQSAGAVELHVDDWRLDYMAFTGHKSLLGPTSTGGVFVRHPQNIEPLIYGGTGSISESTDMPDFAPDIFEAGTGNIAGVFGLLAAVENVPPARHTRSEYLAFIDAVASLPGIRLLRAANPENQGNLFSFCHERLDPAEIATRLSESYGIEVRAGLHCAPLTHQTLGTFPTGTVRLSPSRLHCLADFERVLCALREIFA